MATPLCPYFGECGGCSTQHLDYSLQIDNKKIMLARILGYKDINVFSDNPYNYRNRMDYLFLQNGLGFRKKGQWNKLVDIENCAIANEQNNKLLKEVRVFFKDIDVIDLSKNSGTFRYAVIRTPKNTSSVSFVLNPASTKISEAIEKIKKYAEISSAENIAVTYVANDDSISGDFFMVKGKDMLSESFLGKTFSFSVQGFFQNNSIMAEKMLDYTYNLLKQYNTKESYLLDLFGGVGVFGIVCSELFKEVTVIESFKQSVDAAELNIKENGIRNTKALCLESKHLRKANLKKPLFVIADPPRSGMDPKTILALKELDPEHIVYVSCNPPQLGKDIEKFHKYEIKSAALFDLFPQTNHFEAVVELVKKKEL